MKVEKDYEELLELFNRHKVRYCIVGAYAVAFYERPRYTKDLGILVEPTLQNAKRIIKALDAFGFGSLKLREADFTKMGFEPVRVDLLTSIKGAVFKKIWETKRVGVYGQRRVFFIGKKELIRNKRLTGRQQDLADLEVLSKKR